MSHRNHQGKQGRETETRDGQGRQRGRGQGNTTESVVRGVIPTGVPETWGIPSGLRPPLPFDQRYVKALFTHLPEIRYDLPGAEFGLVNSLTMSDAQGSPELQHTQEHAGNVLTAVIRNVRPTRDSIASATNRLIEADGSITDEGKLSAEQTFWTEMYLLHVFNMRCGFGIEEIAAQIRRIADKWLALDIPRREALARFVLGNIYQIAPEVRNTAEAKTQLVMAVTLHGVAYRDHELINLMTEVDASLVEKTLNAHPASASQVTTRSGSREPQHA